ncbi:MAG: aspartate aminotransferase family protein [Pseudomonadota bacterium]|nr:aspartate aminotransferase family protein [Pseudomonadota bacterium]
MSSSENTSHVMPTYRRTDLRFVSGNGAWLETEAGEKYLDFGSGIAVNTLGHAHPRLVDALKGQAEKLWHVSNLYEIPGQEALAQRLCAESFAELVFFCNSGSEAAEGMIKAMRKFHAAQGQTERVTLIGFAGAFHGRTLSALAAAGNQDYLAGFGPAPGGFVQCPDFTMAALEPLIDETVAGIVIEPVQGEGGVRTVPEAFLKQLRDLCDAKGLLLGFDEVQCGVGRTGKLFAHEWAGITPDVMAIAKGIGGGFPLGAILTTAAVGNCMQPGSHGSTYGGNPLAMAVGLEIMDIVCAPGFLDAVNDKAGYLRQQLSALIDKYPDIFTELRGAGLMVGLKCACANSELVAALRAQNLLAVPAGDNTVRLLPPLNIAQDDMRAGIEALERACVQLHDQHDKKAGGA